jgi:hypothetical protein
VPRPRLEQNTSRTHVWKITATPICSVHKLKITECQPHENSFRTILIAKFGNIAIRKTETSISVSVNTITLLLLHYYNYYLTSALAGGEWSASRPCRFTPGERGPSTFWIGCSVDPRTGLDDMEMKNSCHHRDSNSDPLVGQPVASRYTGSCFDNISQKYICLTLQLSLETAFSLRQIFSELLSGYGLHVKCPSLLFSFICIHLERVDKFC